jgi:pheromone shutdown-related protein TraB
MVQRRLAVGENEVIIIGTAHVSEKSRDEVRDTITEIGPDIVGVELDEARYETLSNEKDWKETDVYRIIRDGKSHLFIASLLLSNYQKRLGEEMGTTPGAEMVAAIEAAGEAKIALIDRNISTTFNRAWKKMTLREKLKILYSMLFSFLDEDEQLTAEDLEKLKEDDMLTSMLLELAEEIPNVKEVFIDERDLYLAARIREELSEGEGKTMVAVVGAGHMNGIADALGRPIDKTELDTVPTGRNWIKAIGWCVPLVFVALVSWGFYANGTDVTVSMLRNWFLINGTLSTIGVLLAWGHPISAAVAFLAAPFTSLNPTIAAGWFAGLTEAYVRKPKVKDFEALHSIKGVTDLWKNKITRTLLVVAFANIGSTIGTVIALPYLVSML